MAARTASVTHRTSTHRPRRSTDAGHFRTARGAALGAERRQSRLARRRQRACVQRRAANLDRGVARKRRSAVGGCQVWLSFDDSSYVQIGVIETPAREGVLAASLAAPSGVNPDTTDTLAVDLSMSGGELPTGSDSDAVNGRTLCFVDGELIAFGLATPTGGSGYDLTDLYRASYGSTGSAHAAGAPFLFLDDAVFKYNLPPVYVEQPLYFKLASFNVWGGGLQDLSAVSAVTYVPAGTGLAFSNSP